MNSCFFSGNLTKDPEFAYTKTGKGYAKASLAESRKYRNNQGEWEEKTNFINLTGWEWIAEKFRDRCQKGTAITVECKLEQSKYYDKKNGEERTWWDFRVVTLEVHERSIPYAGRMPEQGTTPPPIDPETGEEARF